MKKIVLLSALLVFALLCGCGDPSGNADLSNVVFANPPPVLFTFDATNTDVTNSVAKGSTSIDVTPTAADAGASLRIRTIHGATTNFAPTPSGTTSTFVLISGGYMRALFSNGNIIEIEVTAESGTKKTYTYTIIANNL